MKTRNHIKSGTRTSLVFASLLVLLSLTRSTTLATPDLHSAGHALLFDGVDDFVKIYSKCDDVGAPLRGTNGTTLMLWMRVNLDNPKHNTADDWHVAGFPFELGPRLFLALHGDKRGVFGYGEPWSNNPTVSCRMRNSTHIGWTEDTMVPRQHTDDLADGDWHHLALAYSPTNYTIYIDGYMTADCALRAGQTPYTLPLFSTSQFHLGIFDDRDASNANAFPGYIDELRFFSRRLEVDEIRATMHRSLHAGAERDELLLWFPMDAAAGAGTASSAATENLGSVHLDVSLGAGLHARTPRLVVSTAPVAGALVASAARAHPRVGTSSSASVVPLNLTSIDVTTGALSGPANVRARLFSVYMIAGAGSLLTASGTNITALADATHDGITPLELTDGALVYHVASTSARASVVAAEASISIDGGATWSPRVRLVVDVVRNEAPIAGGGGFAISCDGVDDFLYSTTFDWPIETFPSPDGNHTGGVPITVEWWGLADASGELDSALFTIGNQESAADWVTGFNPYGAIGRLFVRQPASSGELHWINGWSFVRYPIRPYYSGWNHFAVTSDQAAGRWARVYINGELAAEGEHEYSSIGAQSLVTPQTIGRAVRSLMVCSWSFWSEVYHRGTLDELRIWRRVRTIDEIRADMRRQLTGSEPGLHGYWNFDDLSPVAPPRGRNENPYMAKDLSANGNDLEFGGCAPCEPYFQGWMPYSEGHGVLPPDDPALADPSGLPGYRVCLPSAKAPESSFYRTSEVFGGPHCYGDAIAPSSRPARILSTAPMGGHVFAQLVEHNREVVVPLNGTDTDGDAVRFSITTLPARGALSYVAAVDDPAGHAIGTSVPIAIAPFVLPAAVRSVVFRPAANGGGAPYAWFTYSVSDGLLSSESPHIELHVRCPAGTRVSGLGDGACTPCVAGTYSPVDHLATACTVCASNTFQSAVGATTCRRCVVGETFSRAGASECISCTSGQPSAGGSRGTLLAIDESQCVRTSTLSLSQVQVLKFRNVSADQRVLIKSLPRNGQLFQYAEDAVTHAPVRGAPLIDAFTRVLEPSEQFASAVHAVSSSRVARNATRLLGEPDVARYGSNANAWSPNLNSAGALEWIEVDFASAVYVTSVAIYESFQPGFVAKIEAWAPVASEWQTLWSLGAASASRTVLAAAEAGEHLHTFAPSMCPPFEPVQRLRLSIDTSRAPAPPELDAVALYGVSDYEDLADVWLSDRSARLVYAVTGDSSSSGSGGGSGGGARSSDSIRSLELDDTLSYSIVSCVARGEAREVQTDAPLTIHVVLTPEVRALSHASANALVALTSIGAVASLAAIALTWHMRKQPIIMAASVPFCIGLASGVLLLFVYGALASKQLGPAPSLRFCEYGEFLYGAAFHLLFGGLLVKSYRVHRIFNSARLRVVKVTNGMLTPVLAALVASDWLFSVLAATAGAPRLENVVYHTEMVLECHYTHEGAWAGARYSLRALLMVVVVALCVRNRDVPTMFNETKSIAFVSYNAAFFFVLQAVLKPLIAGNVDALAAILNFSVLTIGWVSLSLLFFTKFYIVWFAPHKNVQGGNSSVHRTASATGGTPVGASGNGIGSWRSTPEGVDSSTVGAAPGGARDAFGTQTARTGTAQLQMSVGLGYADPHRDRSPSFSSVSSGVNSPPYSPSAAMLPGIASLRNAGKPLGPLPPLSPASRKGSVASTLEPLPPLPPPQ